MDDLVGPLPATLVEFMERPRGEWEQIDVSSWADAGEADSAARAIGALMGEISGYIIPFVMNNNDRAFARKNAQRRRKAVRKAMGYSYP